MFKMDVEIEKYKRAYDDLLGQWESGLYTNGGMPNRDMERNRNFYSNLYSTKFPSRPNPYHNRSLLDMTDKSGDLNKSYTDKYRDKTDFGGNVPKTYRNPQIIHNRILPTNFGQPSTNFS